MKFVNWYLIQYYLFMRMFYTWRYYRNIDLSDKYRKKTYKANQHINYHSGRAFDILHERLKGGSHEYKRID